MYISLDLFTEPYCGPSQTPGTAVFLMGPRLRTRHELRSHVEGPSTTLPCYEFKIVSTKMRQVAVIHTYNLPNASSSPCAVPITSPPCIVANPVSDMQKE